MSKIWYNKITGKGGIFDDAENIANWPNFQEAKPTPPSLTEQVRAERDKLLAASDSMALADRITASWRIYRQALRDLPGQEGFPANVTWPDKPE